MVRTYRYPRPREFDPRYLMEFVRREVSDSLIGLSETPTEIRFDFERELTPEEKERLDRIAQSPPAPAAVYEVVRTDLREEIERSVGVRPVAVVYDPERVFVRIYFDRELTEDQERALSKLLEDATGPVSGRLRGLRLRLVRVGGVRGRG